MRQCNFSVFVFALSTEMAASILPKALRMNKVVGTKHMDFFHSSLYFLVTVIHHCVEVRWILCFLVQLYLATIQFNTSLFWLR